MLESSWSTDAGQYLSLNRAGINERAREFITANYKCTLQDEIYEERNKW